MRFPCRWRSLLACAGLWSLLAGCHAPAPEVDAGESDRLEALLRTALDAWQRDQVAELATRNPPIRFADDDCVAGRVLLGYRLDDPDAACVPFEDVVVRLQLAGPDGQVVERTVAYQLSLTPSAAVLRSEP